ncbi:hypothetical protein JNW88_32305, partial [Micromonospora sp. ATA32]|nr:hypothetical protein [Micromonospora sp. ATA32]
PGRCERPRRRPERGPPPARLARPELHRRATLAFSGSVRGAPTSFDAAFRSPAGTPAAVTISVTCTVSLADLRLSALPGMRTTRTVSAAFTSPLDSYRSRG